MHNEHECKCASRLRRAMQPVRKGRKMMLHAVPYSTCCKAHSSVLERDEALLTLRVLMPARRQGRPSYGML
eukprot:6207793-Pleurochrysis_carterae.AAC.2